MTSTLKWLLAFIGGAGVVSLSVALYIFLSPAYQGDASARIYLRPGDGVVQQLQQAGVRTTGFRLLSSVTSFRLRPGCYDVQPGENILEIFRRLRNGQQTPVSLVLPVVRTMPDMARFLSHHLMMDSTAVADSLRDSTFTARYGFTPQTVPALFVPNTYEVYWSTSLPDFMQRMQREYKAFWNEERLGKAQQAGFTPVEVATLASIVDAETANNAEKPMVAGMYVRRLQIGMPLQADPTVVFALGNFKLRRILRHHLTVQSPYNTYQHAGLPPGPIRVASVAGIDAVLNHVKHNNIYMCAKEDFSGTHNFAATYAEHLRNARRYQRALNARNIK